MNLNEKPTREKYKEFFGINTEQMELLRKDNRIPMTMKQIIERRLNSSQPDWNDNYFDTCDAIVYGKNGKFKIDTNNGFLKEMGKHTKLKNGGIKISKNYYNSLKGKEFDKNTPKEEIWKELIGEFYEPYIKILGYCPEFYIKKSSNYLLRAWPAYRLSNGSGAGGGYCLYDNIGRFVGIASEMQDKEVNNKTTPIKIP